MKPFFRQLYYIYSNYSFQKMMTDDEHKRKVECLALEPGPLSQEDKHNLTDVLKEFDCERSETEK